LEKKGLTFGMNETSSMRFLSAFSLISFSRASWAAAISAGVFLTITKFLGGILKYGTRRRRREKKEKKSKEKSKLLMKKMIKMIKNHGTF